MHLRAAYGTLVLGWALGAPAPVDAQERTDTAANPAPRRDDAKETRKRSLEDMRRRAEATQVLRLRDGERVPAKMVAEPVLRCSDEVRRVFDSTLWVFGAPGRPVAVQKTECWRGRPGFPKFGYCLASLCDDLVEVHWQGEPDWSSTKPGIELRELPGGPKPASAEAVRMVQMKDAFRRVSATIIDTPSVREEVRHLTRALYRYRDPERGIQDGAIFAFGSNGTQPDLLILIELRGPDLVHATWHYAPVKMTTSEVRVRLDGKEVRSYPLQWKPVRNDYDIWIAFFPSRNNPSSMDEAPNR